MPVTRSAFAPNRNDTGGLSVFRRLFVSPEQVAKAGTNVKGYYVAELKHGDIRALSLTVKPDPQEDELPGHSLVPELRFPHDKKEQLKQKEVQLELAKLASRRIVYSPDV